MPDETVTPEPEAAPAEPVAEEAAPAAEPEAPAAEEAAAPAAPAEDECPADCHPLLWKAGWRPGMLKSAFQAITGASGSISHFVPAEAAPSEPN